MFLASSLSFGLPKILSLITTTVSAPITNASGFSFATSFALEYAIFSICFVTGKDLSNSSSTSLVFIVNL